MSLFSLLTSFYSLLDSPSPLSSSTDQNPQEICTPQHGHASFARSGMYFTLELLPWQRSGGLILQLFSSPPESSTTALGFHSESLSMPAVRPTTSGVASGKLLGRVDLAVDLAAVQRFRVSNRITFQQIQKLFFSLSSGKLAMDRSHQPESATRNGNTVVFSIECLKGSSKSDEWSGDMLQTGDIVEEIRIGSGPGSVVFKAPFKGGKAWLQKVLHNSFRNKETSIVVRVRRGSDDFSDLSACIVPNDSASKRQYMLISIDDPNFTVGFSDRTESDCLGLQGFTEATKGCCGTGTVETNPIVF